MKIESYKQSMYRWTSVFVTCLLLALTAEANAQYKNQDTNRESRGMPGNYGELSSLSHSEELLRGQLELPDGKLEVLQETITGTVVDSSTNETLPGVNIAVKGTTTGTSTDSEGAYE